MRTVLCKGLYCTLVKGQFLLDFTGVLWLMLSIGKVLAFARKLVFDFDNTKPR